MAKIDFYQDDSSTFGRRTMNKKTIVVPKYKKSMRLKMIFTAQNCQKR